MRKAGPRGLLLVLALSPLGFAAPAGAVACEAWPGEPAPLPTLMDSDPLRSAWATLRARELAGVARRFEASDPMRARQLWRRLLCIDPSNDEALAGVMRSPAIRVHRPALRNVPADAVRVEDPWDLSLPLGVRVERRSARRPAPPPPAPRPAAPPPPTLGQAVEEVESHVRAARFDAAWAGSQALRERLASEPVGRERAGLTARTEVVAATAALALGREAEAVASLRRALAADPNLALDPNRTSPKVLRALETARAGAGR